MEIENGQFDEVNAKRKARQNAELDRRSSDMIKNLGIAPKNPVVQKDEESEEKPDAKVYSFPDSPKQEEEPFSVTEYIRASAKELGHMAMHAIGDHGGYGKNRMKSLSNPNCSICNGTFWD